MSHHRWSGLGFFLLGIGMGIGIILASDRVYQIEGGVSQAAALLPFGYAFAAGMVATVNPCGVLLLPSLVAFYLGQASGSRTSGLNRASRALLLGLMATIGFIAIFAVVGTIFGLGGHALGNAFPLGGLVIGVVLTAAGGWLALTGQELGLLAASQSMGKVRLSADVRSMFSFGIAYAIASLACTLPVFLVVVGSALATNGIAPAALQFVSYALGMGLVLTVVILGAAFFQGFVTRSVRRIAPYVHRLSAAFLLGAGIFLMKYWLSSGLLSG
jgi:cytochrome c biogenesis protein CcdA